MANYHDIERCVDRLYYFLCELGIIDDEGEDFYKFDDEYRAKYARRFSVEIKEKKRLLDEQERPNKKDNRKGSVESI